MSRLLIGLVAALMLPTASFAGRNDAEWPPPARFDFPYPGKMIIRYLPQPKVVEECHRLGNGKRERMMDQRGCAKRLSPNVCVVVIVNKTYRRATPSAVLRHERGHCNGWGSDHPD